MSPTPTKVVGRRLVGFLIDSIGFSLVAGFLFALMATKKDPSSTVDSTKVTSLHFTAEDDLTLNGAPFVLWLAIVLAVLIGVAVVLEGYKGWTPGKLMLGVRVVDEHGRPPGMGRAFLRLIGWVVDGLPWFILWGLCGLLTSATSRGNRRVGDMIAGTYVVEKAAAGQPVLVEGVPVAAPAVGMPLPVGPPSAGVERDAFGNPVVPRPAGPATGVAPVHPASSAPAAAPARPGWDAQPVQRPVPPAAPAPAPAAAQAPADWYPDPSGKKRLRYWNGSVWTDHTAD